MGRIGFNVRIADGIDWLYYLDVMRRLRPAFGLHIAAPQQSIMNDWTLERALQVVEATEGETKIIVRFPDAKDGEKFHWRQGETFITNSLNAWATLSGATHPNIYFNVLNEPPTNVGEDVNRICDWLSLFMHRATEKGIKLAVFNSGVDQTLHLEEGRYDKLLQTVALYKGLHPLCVHEYSGPSMPNSMSHPPEWMRDPEFIGKLQPDNWPSPAEVQVARTADGSYPPYWLMFRGVWLAIRSRELGLGDPDMVVTEWGFDRLPNLEAVGVYAALEQRYGWPRYKWAQMRGLLTLYMTWVNWWNDWSNDQIAFEQFKWWDRCAPPCYKGACYFAWWPPPEWSDMDIAGRRLLHNLLIQAAAAPQPPPVPEIPPEPIPLPPPTPEPQEPPLERDAPPVWVIPLLLFLLVVILGGFIARQNVSAQGATMENSFVDLFSTLFNWLNVTTTLVWAVPLLQIIIATSKRVLPERLPVSGKAIALTIQVVFWVVWAILQYRGQGDLFQSVITDATPIAEGFFNLFVGGLAGQAVYDKFAGKAFVYRRS